MSNDAPRLSADQLPNAIKTAFAQLYALDCEIADLKATHIVPKTDERTALWRGLKKDSGIERADLELFYKLYKRHRTAQDLEDEADGERIQSNLRRAFTALKQGEVLNFLDALDQLKADLVEQDEDEPPVEAATDGDDGAAPQPLDDADGEGTGAARGEGDGAEEIGPADSDWGQGLAAADDGEVEHGGAVFNKGLEAGRDGFGPETNPHADGTPKAMLWERGRAKGAADRETEQAAHDDAVYEATCAGNKAGEADEAREANPHDAGTDVHAAWDRGWEGGQIARANAAKADADPLDIPEQLDRRPKRGRRGAAAEAEPAYVN